MYLNIIAPKSFFIKKTYASPLKMSIVTNKNDVFYRDNNSWMDLLEDYGPKKHETFDIF